ncbi:MAG: hypothetical protein ACM3WV_04065 [Bacillota bacterium]
MKLKFPAGMKQPGLFLLFILYMLLFVYSEFWLWGSHLFCRAGMGAVLLFWLALWGEKILPCRIGRQGLFPALLAGICGPALYAWRESWLYCPGFQMSARIAFFVLLSALLALNAEKILGSVIFYWRVKQYDLYSYIGESYAAGEDLVAACSFLAYHLGLLFIVLQGFCTGNWLANCCWAYFTTLALGMLIWAGANGRWERQVIPWIAVLEENAKDPGSEMPAKEERPHWQGGLPYCDILSFWQERVNLKLCKAHRLELAILGAVFLLLGLILS